MRRWVLARVAAAGVLAVGLMAAAGPAAAQSVGQLVDTMLAAYGGRERLEGVRTLHMTGTTTALRNGQTGTVERWFAVPDRLRIDIRYPSGEGEDRILDGAEGWRNGARAQDQLRASMVLQAARFRLPLLLAELPAQEGGRIGAQAGVLRVLSVDLGAGLGLDVMVDQATGLIRRSRGRLAFGGQTMEFTTDYDDFRLVDGVLIPHHERHGAMGSITGESTLQKVEVDAPLGDAVFRPQARR